MRDKLKKRVTKNQQDLYGIFEFHGQKFKYDTKSLFVLDQKNVLRCALVWLVNWTWFERAVNFGIIVQTTIMAFENYERRIVDGYEETTMDRVTFLSGQIFAWIFISEFVLKVLAMGFFLHRKSYLRSWWNRFDFVIVLISFVEVISPSTEGALTLIRMLRLLKPLRSIKALKTLRKMISLLLHSLAGLVNVFIFMAFVFSIFAILGVNIFCGNQYRACRMTPDIVYPEDGSDPFWPKFDDLDMLCYEDK